MKDDDWLRFADRLHAMERILFPLVDARRPLCRLDILDIACDLRRAASVPFSGTTGEPLLPNAYGEITCRFSQMHAAELPTLVSTCELMLDDRFGALWNRSSAHLTPTDRQRIENKLLLQLAAEMPITRAQVPDIYQLPGLSWTHHAWTYRSWKLAHKLGLPHPDSTFRLHERLPLSARDPRYNLEDQFVG